MPRREKDSIAGPLLWTTYDNSVTVERYKLPHLTFEYKLSRDSADLSFSIQSVVKFGNELKSLLFIYVF